MSPRRTRGARTATSVAARPSFAPESEAKLHEKHRQLCAKYDDLVRKYESMASSYMGVVRLGWWALRTAESGLALVRGDAIEMSNPRWIELERCSDDGERWERVGPDGGESPGFPSLRSVAQAEARLLRSGSARTARYRRTHSQQVLEIRSERLDTSDDVVAIFAHDVTSRVQSEAQLRLAEQALHHRGRLQVAGQLACGVAHDLNNALNVMRLRVELMRGQAGGRGEDANLVALARIIDGAAARVSRMHELSRKQLDASAGPVDLGEVIREAAALAQTQFEQRSLAEGTQVQVACDLAEVPAVRANAVELEHLFVNLLLNARDAMPTGGKVAIRATRDGNSVIVTVADEGTGIAEDHLERVFESFFTTKGPSGTGLGLAMARGTMARLGGTIQARNLDRGAEFILRFPSCSERRVPAAPRPPPERIAGPLRVLVVDDDRDCLDVTEAVLQAEGVTVVTAQTGAAAIELLQRDRFDLLLCDIGMPEMSGWQVARTARQLWPSMAIWMLTGWADEFGSSDPHREGVNGILGKPVQLDELRAVMARAGDGAGRHDGTQAAGTT